MREILGINLPDNVIVIDTETTGLDTKTCEVCEIAMLERRCLFEHFIKPTKPIPPEVSAIHHITDGDVTYASSWTDYKAGLAKQLAGKVLVAHNAEYDKAVLGIPDLVWICTYKCALIAWPDAPGHKNEVLRYHLKLGSDRGRNGLQHPHTAGHDVVVTARILMELLKERTLETLIQISSMPAKLPKMPFGKHFGKRWSEIDSGYLGWITKQVDMSPDVKNCADAELKSRR